MRPFPPWWPQERNVMRWRRMDAGKSVFVRSVVMVLCSTLTSQVIGSSRGDGKRRSGAHGRRLLAIYRQHGKVLLGNQTYCMPLAVVKPWTWGRGDRDEKCLQKMPTQFWTSCSWSVKPSWWVKGLADLLLGTINPSLLKCCSTFFCHLWTLKQV